MMARRKPVEILRAGVWDRSCGGEDGKPLATKEMPTYRII
jgi:hypothetical protein